jgi:hypothetical protein
MLLGCAKTYATNLLLCRCAILGPTGFGLTSLHGSRKQILLGAPFALKHLRKIKTPQRRFSPDKTLTNGGDCPAKLSGKHRTSHPIRG